MAAMMIALIGLGLYPQPLLNLTQPVVASLQELISLTPTTYGVTP